MRYLDSLPEASGRKMNLAPLAFGGVVAKPILQKRGTDLKGKALSSFRSKHHRMLESFRIESMGKKNRHT
jgi:hypothetical protein